MKPGSNVADSGDGRSLQSKGSIALTVCNTLEGGPMGVVGVISFCGLPDRSMSGSRMLVPTCDTLGGRSLNDCT